MISFFGRKPGTDDCILPFWIVDEVSLTGLTKWTKCKKLDNDVKDKNTYNA